MVSPRVTLFTRELDVSADESEFHVGVTKGRRPPPSPGKLVDERKVPTDVLDVAESTVGVPGVQKVVMVPCFRLQLFGNLFVARKTAFCQASLTVAVCATG